MFILEVIFLQGIFFCNEKNIPKNIRNDVINLKSKLFYLVKNSKELTCKIY